MKIAVINFSGNVGKTTIARHLLAPRIPGAELIAIESTNADEGEKDALRGKDFAKLQQFIQTRDDVIVDIGASNVEDLLALMKKYQGSHEDFDYFVIPAVSDAKQQKDTGNSAAKLVKMGVKPAQIKIVLNRVEDGANVNNQFGPLLAFLRTAGLATVNPNCYLTENEIYQRVKHDGRSISDLAHDQTDYKAQIAQANSQHQKIALADQLAVKRLASGVLPELDACFASLNLV